MTDPVEALTDLLMDVPAVKDRERRTNLVLPSMARRGVTVPATSFSRERDAVMTLAEFCYGHPGRLRALRDAVVGVEGGSDEANKLKDHITNLLQTKLLQPRVLDDHRIEELKDILQALRDTGDVGEALPRLYRDSVGPTGPDPPEPRFSDLLHRLYELVDWLNDLHLLDEEPIPCQLVAFVERLAAQTDAEDPDTADELRHWSDRTIRSEPSLGVRPTPLRELRKKLKQPTAPATRTAPTASSRPALLVEVRPRACDQRLDPLDKQYDLTAYLFVDGRQVPDFHAAAAARLGGAAREVNAWLGKVAREHLPRTSHHIVVEVFLPIELLRHPVDRWPNTWDAHFTLGQQYRMVVRVLDRRFLWEGRSQGYWEQKWELLENHPEAGAEPIRWLETDDGVRHDQLTAQLTAEERRVIAVGLHYEPTDGCLEAALKAGTPVMVWTRARGMEHFRDRCVQELALKRFGDLPGLILAQRKQAVGRDGHVGEQLALLWDEPGREPLRPPLQGP